jgi:hypothetical protein
MCSTHICDSDPKPCANEGHCSADTTSDRGFLCECRHGYSGPRCEQAPDPCKWPAEVNCGAHGTCVAQDQNRTSCQCRHGYSGSRCELAPDPCMYPQQVQCGAHGRCDGGQCVCMDGYRGSICNLSPPPKPRPPPPPVPPPPPPPPSTGPEPVPPSYQPEPEPEPPEPEPEPNMGLATSVEVQAVDGVLGHTTYRLRLLLAPGMHSVYALYGDRTQPPHFPAAYFSEYAGGKIVGGPRAAFVSYFPDLAFTSFISIGPDTGDTEVNYGRTPNFPKWDESTDFSLGVAPGPTNDFALVNSTPTEFFTCCYGLLLQLQCVRTYRCTSVQPACTVCGRTFDSQIASAGVVVSVTHSGLGTCLQFWMVPALAPHFGGQPLIAQLTLPSTQAWFVAIMM